MLNSPSAILDHSPPFVFVSANSEWLLVVAIVKNQESLRLKVVEKKNNEFSERDIDLEETPFYVGADIWELNYGATLMTLNHDSLKQHPATKLWQEWVKYKNS